MGIEYNMHMSPHEAKVANANLLEEITGGNTATAADAAGKLLRTKIREESFTRKILEPKPIDRASCQIDADPNNPEHPRLYKLEQLAVQTDAGVVTLVGDYSYEHIKTRFPKVYMQKIQTKTYSLTEEEIYALDSFFIHDAVNDLLTSLEYAEDSMFVRMMDTIIAANSSDPNFYRNTAETVLTRSTFTDASKMLSSRELDVKHVLMHSNRQKDILAWDGIEIGSQATSKLFVEGLSYDNIWGGVSLQATLKKFYNQNKIYYITGGDYLGRFYIFKEPSVNVEKKMDKVIFYAYEWIGMYLLDTSVAMLELNV